MEIKVETATIRMLDAFCAIEKQCFSGEAFSKQQIGYLLRDCNSVSLAARVNGEIVGFIIGRVDFVRSQPVGHVMTIDVLLACRRMGIGQRLLLEAEALFKQRGATECRLEAREDNTAAVHLYSKLEYKKIAVLENYYGKSHGLYFRKYPL